MCGKMSVKIFLSSKIDDIIHVCLIRNDLIRFRSNDFINMSIRKRHSWKHCRRERVTSATGQLSPRTQPLTPARDSHTCLLLNSGVFSFTVLQNPQPGPSVIINAMYTSQYLCIISTLTSTYINQGPVGSSMLVYKPGSVYY